MLKLTAPVAALIVFVAAHLAVAAVVVAATPPPQTVVVETEKPFGAYVAGLKTAIEANGMGIVADADADACASCGANSIGVTIPGNRVIIIFKPQFAVRVLKASKAAGIEAPLRLYVTENADGTATLTYRRPSTVFGVYDNAELDALAKELDAIVAQIVADSRG